MDAENFEQAERRASSVRLAWALAPIIALAWAAAVLAALALVIYCGSLVWKAIANF